MTTAEWTADAINILLIVLIIAVFVAGIIAIRKFITERFIAKWNIWSASVFGFLFMAYLVLHVLADLNLLANWDVLSDLREILPEDWAQIFLVLGLVVATGFYALMAFRQAKASAKMAEEMKKQRYDTVRPVIDFKFMESYPIIISQGLTPKEQEERNLSSGIRCMLCNIGIGPATDVYSFTLTVSGERRQIYLGSLVKGETTPETILSLEQRDDCWFSVANYRDAYGRSFESSREVHLDVGTGKPELGPLNIVLV